MAEGRWDPNDPRIQALVRDAAGENLLARAQHMVWALNGKPTSALNDFDRLESIEVIELLGKQLLEARALLTELKTSRPLLLYGDAWIRRIDELLQGRT